MCCPQTNNNPSPMPAATSLCFSASDKPIISSSVLIDDVDCFNNTCMLEFDTIGLPYGLLVRSSTSCVIVVIHNPYFLALFISQNKKFADMSLCNMIRASSQITSLGFFVALTCVRIKFSTLYIAGVLSASSRSLILNIVSLSLMFTLV